MLKPITTTTLVALMCGALVAGSAGLAALPRGSTALAQNGILRVDADYLDGRSSTAATRALATGQRVLVRSDGSKKAQNAIKDTFGVSAASDRIVVQRDDSGRIVMDATMPGDATSPAGEKALLDSARAAVTDSASQTDTALEPDSRQPDGSAYAPAFEGTFNFHALQDGITMRKDYHVLRQIRQQGDQFRVLVKDSYTVTPKGIGLQQDRWRALLPVLNSVSATSILAGASGVQLARQEPASDSRTDFTVAKTVTSETGFSVGAGLEGAGGQQEKDLTAKAPLSFGFNSSKSVSEELSYTVKDYRIQASSNTEKVRSEATTTTVLADAIRADKSYFNTRGLPDLSEKKMTPWMRAQQFSQVNEWLVPAHGNDFIALASNVTRDLLQYHGKRDNFETQPAPKVIQQTATKGHYVQVDLDNPLLTRAPSVYIQSADGSSRFLGVPHDNDVTLGSPRGETDKSYLWSLDEEGRYINARTNMALTWHPTTGRLTVERKSLAREQQWQWRADRLHNARAVNGTSHLGRLMGIDGTASAAAGVNYPINENSPLLDPWSSYPDPPVAGDVVPRLQGPQRPIPTSWITDGYTPRVTERWTVTMFRQGILGH